MIQGENNLPGEKVLSTSLSDGVFSTNGIDPLWGGMNEQYGKSLPVDGYIQYVITRQHHLLGDYMEMRTVFVDKDKRNHGVGRKLFEKIEEIAREQDIKRIVVKVTCSPNDANPFCRFLPAMKYQNLPASDYDFDWEKRL